MRGAWVVLAVALLAPGCFDHAVVPAAAPVTPTGPALAQVLRPDCPTECGRLADPTAPNLGEPDAAVDPADSSRRAIVAQALEPGVLTSPAGIALSRFVLFTSQGGSWTERALPAIDGPGGSPVEGQVLSDPQVAFGAGGRLFVSGMATGGALETPTWRPFVLASDDLGATWATVRFLASDHNVDQPKLAADGAGHMALTWTSYNGSEFLAPGWAWSGDNGASWDGGVYGLTNATACSDGPVTPLIQPDGFLAACTRPGHGSMVSRWTSGGWQDVADLEAKWGHLFGLTKVGQQILALVGNSQSLSLVNVREPAPTQVDLRMAAHSDDGVHDVLVTAFGGDGRGLHVMFRELAAAPGGGVTFGRVGHVSWDWTGATIVDDALLTALPASPTQSRQVIVDDYHGIDTAGGMGLMAWGDDGAIHWATLSPPG